MFINFIRKSEERKKQLAFGFIVIGTLIAMFAIMKKYVDYQEAEHQKQLDEVERNGYILEQQQKDKKQMYLKMLYKEDK